MAPKPITVRRLVRIDRPVEQLWDILSQTSKVNHAVGLPAITFSERTAPDGRTEILAAFRIYGMRVHWIEQPFEWIHLRELSVERIFDGVPLLYSITTGTRFTPVTIASTDVEVFASIRAESGLGRAIGWAVVRPIIQNEEKLLRDLARRPQAESVAYFPPKRKAKSLNARALDEFSQRLKAYPVAPALRERLLDLVATGRDEDVAEMQPFVLADQWRTDRLDTLRMFLYATEAGLLDMNWDVLCPNCRVSRQTTRSLRDLGAGAHCEVCHISYDVNFDEYVELRFAVNPTVRAAGNMMFCSLGSPALNQHILVQQRLRPGESRTLPLCLEPGGYRIRMLGSEQRCQLTIDDQFRATAASVTMTRAGMAESAVELGISDAALECRNDSDATQLLIIERDAWGSGRVSAALVSTLNEFRTMFSSEVLAPGLGLSIKNLTILFSDIKNSTPMYEQWGDSSAYAVVRDHFTTLFGAIEANNGAVVKTIGDAVMAVFATPTSAVTAALAIHAGIEQANAGRPDRPPLVIKLGLHTGPCIAVNANEVLDYFGTTVNAAARAQALSVGRDVVMTADVMHAPGVAALLEGHALEVEEFMRDLKGLSQTYTLFRLRPIDAPKAMQAEA